MHANVHGIKRNWTLHLGLWRPLISETAFEYHSFFRCKDQFSRVRDGHLQSEFVQCIVSRRENGISKINLGKSSGLSQTAPSVQRRRGERLWIQVCKHSPFEWASFVPRGVSIFLKLPSYIVCIPCMYTLYIVCIPFWILHTYVWYIQIAQFFTLFT
jgi:hypothetical protein